jgi:hypothetical protein
MGGGIKALLKAGASWLVKKGAQKAVKTYGDDVFRAGIRRIAPSLERSTVRSAVGEVGESAASRAARMAAIRKAEEEAAKKAAAAAAKRQALLGRPVTVAKRYASGKADDAITLAKNTRRDFGTPSNWKPSEGPIKSLRKTLGINDTIKVRSLRDPLGRSGLRVPIAQTTKRGISSGLWKGGAILGSGIALAPDRSDYISSLPGAAVDVVGKIPIVSDAIKFTNENPDASMGDVFKEGGRIGFQYTPGYGTVRTGARVAAQFQKDGSVTVPGVGEVKSLSKAIKEDGTLMALLDAGLDLLDVAEVSTFLKPASKQAVDEAIGAARNSTRAPQTTANPLQVADAAATPTQARKAAEAEANGIKFAQTQAPGAPAVAPVGLAQPNAPIVQPTRARVLTNDGRSADDLVAAAERQAPKYLEDIRSTADETGAAFYPEFEKNAVKRNTDRIAEKIAAKNGLTPTDTLRSTLLINDPADAGRIIESMQAKGYQIWNDPVTGKPDIDDLYSAGVEGYKHVAVKFTTGPEDDVVKELLVMTPGMFQAKKTLGGHDIYDVTRALEGLVKADAPPKFKLLPMKLSVGSQI